MSGDGREARLCRAWGRGRTVGALLGRAEGYNLVVVMMIITVLNILVAAALPLWSHAVKRDKEEELIFRGLQYAEAIRVFQRRHGRFPTRLEELIEVEPRSIRRLWKDPMTESGEWGLLVQAPQARRPGRPGQPGPRQAPPGRGSAPPPVTSSQEAPPVRGQAEIELGRVQPRGVGVPTLPRPAPGGGPGPSGNLVPIPPSGEEGQRRVVAGQIQGVYSASDETAVKSFLGRDRYDQWHFTAALIRFPGTIGGDHPLPRLSSQWIGRPFRGQLGPKPGAPAAGRELVGGSAPRRRDGQSGGRERERR